MKSILIPLDFSEVSSNALAYGINIARAFDAKLNLLHAYHTTPANLDIKTKSHQEELAYFRKSALSELESIQADITQKFHLECEIINEEGFALEKIISYANSWDYDLLIIGTESRGPLDKFVFGSITGKVLDKVQCRLLIVPQASSFDTPKNIAFALDYHDTDQDDLLFLEELANRFDSELSVIRVTSGEKDDEWESKMMKDFRFDIDDMLPDNDISWHFILGKNVPKQLEKFVNNYNVDLLATSKSKLSLLAQLFSGSITKKVFYRTDIPLLVFHAEDSDLRSYRMEKDSRYE
ncbi:universal stress protein [Ekhidna sp.]